MSLTDIVKQTKRNLALGAFGLTSLLGATNSAQADKFVDSTMSHTTINSVIASATPGETVYFDCGVYQLPMIQGASIILNDGVNLAKDACDGEAVIRGATTTSGAVIRGYSVNNNISGLTLENAALGIFLDADFDPSTPITISNNVLQDLGEGVQWTNKEVLGDNSTASVFVTDNYFLNTSRGNIFNNRGEPTETQSAWAEISGNTFENMSESF